MLKQVPKLSSGLHHTHINVIESHLVIKGNSDDFTLWHDRLGHPSTIMMRKIIENSYGHLVKPQEIYQGNKITCTACFLENIDNKP